MAAQLLAAVSFSVVMEEREYAVDEDLNDVRMNPAVAVRCKRVGVVDGNCLASRACRS